MTQKKPSQFVLREVGLSKGQIAINQLLIIGGAALSQASAVVKVNRDAGSSGKPCAPDIFHITNNHQLFICAGAVAVSSNPVCQTEQPVPKPGLTIMYLHMHLYDEL